MIKILFAVQTNGSSQQHFTHPKYRSDIDGLRAIAVISVVGFHAFPYFIKGGFVGVDIFFVISGYLISSIIFSNLENNSFSYAKFYARRIKRIFPSLILVLLSSFAFGWYVLFSDEFRQLGKHMAAGAGFVSNFAFWNESGYFDNSADTKPLLHLWSLAIEEQFYILWPLLLGFVWKRKSNFLTLTLLIAVGSFAFNIFLAFSNPVADFYSPLSRFWELMVGGILAYLTLHKSEYLSQKSNWQSAIGIILVALGILLVNTERAFPGMWALLPTVGTFLVISAGAMAWLNKNLLSNRMLVNVGLFSYPLYMWHWPLLSFARIIKKGELAVEVALVLVGVSFLLAWLTYKLIENNIRYSKKKITVISLSMIMVLCLILGLLAFKQTWEPRNSGSIINKMVNAAGDWEYPRGLQAIKINGQAIYFNKSGNENVLFWGDSHIEQYSPRIIELATHSTLLNKSVYFATSGGCLPIPNVFEDSHIHINCSAFREEAMNLASRSDINSVVIGAAWNEYFIDETKTIKHSKKAFEYYFLVNGEKVYFRHGNGRKLALASLEIMLKQLSSMKKVYLLLDNPRGDQFNPKKYFEGGRLQGISVKETMAKTTPFDSEQQLLRNELIEIANRVGATIIDPIPTLCPNGYCIIQTNDGIPIYKDNGHLRPFYVKNNANYIDIAVKNSGN